MQDLKIMINRIIVDLANDEGEVIPVQTIYSMAEGTKKEEVLKVLKELESEGKVTFIDKDTIQLNM